MNQGKNICPFWKPGNYKRINPHCGLGDNSCTERDALIRFEYCILYQKGEVKK